MGGCGGERKRTNGEALTAGERLPPCGVAGTPLARSEHRSSSTSLPPPHPSHPSPVPRRCWPSPPPPSPAARGQCSGDRQSARATLGAQQRSEKTQDSRTPTGKAVGPRALNPAGPTGRPRRGG
eukprot:4034704-Pyramimonas_sp.AAC.1